MLEAYDDSTVSRRAQLHMSWVTMQHSSRLQLQRLRLIGDDENDIKIIITVGKMNENEYYYKRKNEN